MVALAACDPERAGQPEVNRDHQSPSTIPQGGRVTFGVLGEPPSLDPYSEVASDLTYFLARPVYRSLYRTSPDGIVEPDLVGSMTADGRRSVLVELSRARWSTGASITATDVVRSVRRAREPSGFTGLDAEAIDRRTMRLTGDISGDWAERLAEGSFVVPRRADLTVGSGPFVATRYVPGLEIVYEPNPRAEEAPHLDRIRVQFISSLDIMLALLDEKRLDAAAPPSAMNLDERVAALGLEQAELLGRETIALDLERADDDLRAAIAGAVDLEHLAEGVIRDQGRAVDSPLPDLSSGEGAEIRLGTASGDEALQLMQRILQRSLAGSDIKAELVQVDPATFYGEWQTESPLDAALERSISVDRRDPRQDDLGLVPLFTVESFLAWNEGVGGLEPHGGLDGPLWNAEDWWRD